MATAYEIPIIYDQPRFKIRTVLDEIELVLFFNFNTREEKWFLDIQNSNEESVKSGLPLNVDQELITQFKDIELPPGSLFLYDASENHLECGLNDLGDRCKLIYYSAN